MCISSRRNLLFSISFIMFWIVFCLSSMLYFCVSVWNSEQFRMLCSYVCVVLQEELFVSAEIFYIRCRYFLVEPCEGKGWAILCDVLGMRFWLWRRVMRGLLHDWEFSFNLSMCSCVRVESNIELCRARLYFDHHLLHS